MIKLGGLQASRVGQGGGDLGLWERPKVFFFGATCNGALLLLDHRLSEFTRWS